MSPTSRSFRFRNPSVFWVGGFTPTFVLSLPVFTVLRLISFFFGGGIELLLFWLFWTVVVVALGGRLVAGWVVAPVAMYAGG